jgi:hypothetical protein
MTALEEEGRLWLFDSSSHTWSYIDPVEGSPIPASRSFHTAAALGGVFYVHAGCHASGRLEDLWGFDIKQRKWTELMKAPGLPRGGTSLAATAGKLWRVHGFDGKDEIGGVLDV